MRYADSLLEDKDGRTIDLSALEAELRTVKGIGEKRSERKHHSRCPVLIACILPVVALSATVLLKAEALVLLFVSIGILFVIAMLIYAVDPLWYRGSDSLSARQKSIEYLCDSGVFYFIGLIAFLPYIEYAAFKECVGLSLDEFFEKRADEWYHERMTTHEDILFSVGSISASSAIGISPGCLNTAVCVSAS